MTTDEMKTDDIQTDENGMELARKLAEEEEGIGRKPQDATQYIIPTIAVFWSLFQLAIAKWLIIDSTYIRAIHLGFALVIVFLNYPLLKKPRFGLTYLAQNQKIPLLDFVIAGVAGVSALYIAIDYIGIAQRYGSPIARDLIFGILLTVLLLEAARRVIGPALPIIAMVFITYAFLGPYMPDVIAFKGVSLNRFVGQMTMSTEGIYGIPLDVSATIVFLFVLFGAMLDKAGGRTLFYPAGLKSSGRI